MTRPRAALVAALATVALALTAAVAVTNVRDHHNGNRPMTVSRMGPVAPDEFAYLAHMVAHHQEAVDAAQHLARSERPQMRAFGESIVATQSLQIDQMSGWLQRWYPGRTPAAEYRPMMRDLSGLTGDRLDRVFLDDMVGHHMEAVMMSQQLVARDGAAHTQVVSLARRIRDEQHDEIFQMRRWLRDWYGIGWRGGEAGRHHGGAGMGVGAGPGQMDR